MLIDRSVFFILYDSIYYFTAVLVVLSYLSIEINNDIKRQRSIGRVLVFIPLISIIILVGLREYNVGTDTYNYYNFLWLANEDFVFTNDFMFSLLSLVLNSLGLTYTYFLSLVSFLFFYILYLSLRKISNFYSSNILFSFFVCLSFFFYQSLSINVIRQGVSLVFILLAYSYFINKEDKLKVLVSIFLSLSFHATSIVPLLIFTFCYATLNYIKMYYYYFIYILCIFLSYMSYGLDNISPFIVDLIGSDEKRVGYLSGDDFGYDVGFKIQFVLFNTVFLIVALIIRKKILDPKWRLHYYLLIRYYILASSVFFMAFQIPFSDRWGLFSWFFIPLFFIPVFSSKNIKSGIKIHWILFLISTFIGLGFYV